MTKKKLYAHPGWQSCSFEGAEMSTLAIGLETTFLEKLQWLEEAENFVLAMRGGRAKMAAASRRLPKRKSKQGRSA